MLEGKEAVQWRCERGGTVGTTGIGWELFDESRLRRQWRNICWNRFKFLSMWRPFEKKKKHGWPYNWILHIIWAYFRPSNSYMMPAKGKLWRIRQEFDSQQLLAGKVLPKTMNPLCRWACKNGQRRNFASPFPQHNKTKVVRTYSTLRFSTNNNKSTFFFQ